MELYLVGLGSSEDWATHGLDFLSQLLGCDLFLGGAVLEGAQELMQGDLSCCLILHLGEDQVDVS